MVIAVVFKLVNSFWANFFDLFLEVQGILSNDYPFILFFLSNGGGDGKPLIWRRRLREKEWNTYRILPRSDDKLS